MPLFKSNQDRTRMELFRGKLGEQTPHEASQIIARIRELAGIDTRYPVTEKAASRVVNAYRKAIGEYR